MKLLRANNNNNTSPRSPRSVAKELFLTLAPIPEDESCRDWTLNPPLRQPCDDSEELGELIAMERTDRRMHPFHRRSELDRIAERHAVKMASVSSVFHSVTTVEDLQEELLSDTVGENVQRGDSIESMHHETMSTPKSINRSNILSCYFDEFGSATAYGSDGKIYCCQVFRKGSGRATTSG